MRIKFRQHRELEGRHAFLSASKYHWIRYDAEKLTNSFKTQLAAMTGTRLHNLAAEAIKLRVKVAGKTTMALYVNDAIGFRMTPEVPLFYSENCFGTADAIAFSTEGRQKELVLRISDLKTGVNEASFDQLRIYAAMFCLEYEVRPTEIKIILRIYQNNTFKEEEPELDDIINIMDKIKTADAQIEKLKAEEFA